MFQLLILTESILVSFIPKTFIYLQRHFWGMFVKLNGTTLYLFIIYWLGWDCFLFNWYVFFNHRVDTTLKPVNILCELWLSINFDFPYKTYFFKIKYAQLNAPDVYLKKRFTNDKKVLWQNLKTRVSAIIKELTQSMYCKCTTTWIYLYMDA